MELPTGPDVEGDTAKGEYLVEGVVGSCQLKTPTGTSGSSRPAACG